MTEARPPQDATPLVAWEPPPESPAATASTPGGYAAPPVFTVRAILSDTFARYGADALRLVLVSAVASALSWLGSFAAPASADPFGRPTGFVDVGGLLGLASFVVGIVGGAAMFAIAQGGRAAPLGRLIRRAVERSGWYFLTSILLGVAFIAGFVVALVPIGLFFFISPALALVPVLVALGLFLWVGVRLSLALPASVADNRNSIEALTLSWRVSKPGAVWLRLLGAALLLGLLVTPAALGSVLIVFPALFSGGRELALLLVPAVGFALFTPLAALLSFSAYRRLVPPLEPSWTMPPATPSRTTAATAPLLGDGAPLPDTAGAPPAPGGFRVPPLGTAAKAILALIVAFDIAGILAIPYGVSAMERFVREGFRGFPGGSGWDFPGLPGGDGVVVPGQVAFGADADLETCSIRLPLFVATASTEVEWIASLDDPVTPEDEVFLRISRNGRELTTTLQDPGTYDCLGSEDADPVTVEGIYTYDVVVNGSVEATGSLFVR